MAERTFASLLARCCATGLTPEFVRAALVPEWWELDDEANADLLPEAEFMVARHFKVSIAIVRDPMVALPQAEAQRFYCVTCAFEAQIPCGAALADRVDFATLVRCHQQRCAASDRWPRAREKDASREADELALASGTTPADIERKNAFITADRTIVHWDKSKPL